MIIKIKSFLFKLFKFNINNDNVENNVKVEDKDLKIEIKKEEDEIKKDEKNEEKKEEKKEKKIDDDSNNNSQIFSSIFSSIMEGIKITMATLLSVFVPQYCESTGTTCTLKENFSDLTSFNEFVIFMNFLTLGLFIKLIFVQNKREAYLISHLDESKDYPYNSLEENIKSYPRILFRVKKHNKILKKYTSIVTYIFSLNVLFSSILIFYYFYDGFRSITTLLSNVLLVSTKLYHLNNISKECNQYKTKAMSTIHQTTISYNIPDKNYDTYGLFYTINKNKNNSRCKNRSYINFKRGYTRSSILKINKNKVKN